MLMTHAEVLMIAADDDDYDATLTCVWKLVIKPVYSTVGARKIMKKKTRT